MIDLDFYEWRERVIMDGVERLLIPCGDPHRFEFAADGISASVEEAVAYLENFGFEEDYDPNTWVLVHYVGSICEVGTDEPA